MIRSRARLASVIVGLGAVIVSACAGAGPSPPEDPNGALYGRSPATAGLVAR